MKEEKLFRVTIEYAVYVAAPDETTAQRLAQRHAADDSALFIGAAHTPLVVSAREELDPDWADAYPINRRDGDTCGDMLRRQQTKEGGT